MLNRFGVTKWDRVYLQIRVAWDLHCFVFLSFSESPCHKQLTSALLAFINGENTVIEKAMALRYFIVQKPLPVGVASVKQGKLKIHFRMKTA